MRRYFFTLIILVCSTLLSGCSRQENIKKEDTEEKGQQMTTNQMMEDDTVNTEDLLSASSATDEESLVLRYREMPDTEVSYIPELGYHGSARIYVTSPINYVCWKDILMIGDTIYRRKGGIYERTAERLQDWISMEYDNLHFYQIEQCANLLIVQDQINLEITIYDMDDSKQIATYPFESLFWHVYQGKIYYRELHKGLFSMDPLSGENEVIYACEGGGDLIIRDNGDMIIEIGDRSVSNVIEFWLLSYDDQGDLNAEKIWETNEYEVIFTVAFNDQGAFVYGVSFSNGNDFFILRDNGEKEQVVTAESWTLGGDIIMEEGYLLWDSQILSEREKEEILGSVDQREKAATIVDSISFYDFQGNKLKTWQLIEDEMLEAGYLLKYIVYDNGEILAFYENEELDDLFISNVQTL